METIKEKFADKFSIGHIADGYNYLEFRRGHNTQRFYLEELGFKAGVFNQLRLMNINIKEIDEKI